MEAIRTDISISDSQLDPPDWKMVLVSLDAVMELAAVTDLLEGLCSELAISYGTNDVDDLERLFARMSNFEGLIAVVGRSLAVRMSVYKALDHTNAAHDHD